MNDVDKVLREDILMPIYTKIEELIDCGSFSELDNFILLETETPEIATALVLGSQKAREHLKNWEKCRDRAVWICERKIKFLRIMKDEA